MKKVFMLMLVIAFIVGCSLLASNQLTITINEDFLDQIEEIIVSIVNGDDVDTETITEITETIKITYEGTADMIMVNAYNEDGILLFTGKGEPDAMGALEIILDDAGAGVANHIVIFQDVDPWSCTAMVDMLEENGFNEGTGENEYEFVTSDEFNGVELSPFNDLVIIANDQTQDFYDELATIDDDINDFIHSGGTILWEVCDNGWSLGDIVSAGIELPDNVNINLQYESSNTIEKPDHKMFKDISGELVGNYASHEYLTNLPDETNILMTGTSSGEPTLVIYPYGGGLVFMTGQPFEHAYTHGYSMGTILPRLIKLILGEEITGNETTGGGETKSIVKSSN